VNGGWNETLASPNYNWDTYTDVNVYSTGPGRYRNFFDTVAQFDGMSWQIYFRQTNCTGGKYLTYYNGFQSSINTLRVTSLSVSACNSQRMGTLSTP
jgi:hypothetical protein